MGGGGYTLYFLNATMAVDYFFMLSVFGIYLSSKRPEKSWKSKIEFAKNKGYISKMVNSRNRINEKIIFLHVNNTEEICDLMHSFLD